MANFFIKIYKREFFLSLKSLIAVIFVIPEIILK